MCGSLFMRRVLPRGRRQASERDVSESSATEFSEAAERYAQAAFELADDANALPTLDSDFKTFAAAWNESADLREVARSPLIEPMDKARALTAVATKLGISELGRKVIGVVAANRRAGELPGVFAAFATLYARHLGQRRVELISARPLSDADKAAILSSLAGAIGEKVDAETRVDESLIGGFVVRVGSRQFDASVKSKLDALKLALKTA